MDAAEMAGLSHLHWCVTSHIQDYCLGLPHDHTVCLWIIFELSAKHFAEFPFCCYYVTFPPWPFSFVWNWLFGPFIPEGVSCYGGMLEIWRGCIIEIKCMASQQDEMRPTQCLMYGSILIISFLIFKLASVSHPPGKGCSNVLSVGSLTKCSRLLFAETRKKGYSLAPFSLSLGEIVNWELQTFSHKKQLCVPIW